MGWAARARCCGAGSLELASSRFWGWRPAERVPAAGRGPWGVWAAQGVPVAGAVELVLKLTERVPAAVEGVPGEAGAAERVPGGAGAAERVPAAGRGSLGCRGCVGELQVLWSRS